MDSSPSKRRKTSPSGSVEVTVENTYLARLPQNGARPSKRRSSLISPTKASLACVYPSLLPRAKSAEPSRPVSTESYTSLQEPNGKGGVNISVAHDLGTSLGGSEARTNGVEDLQGMPASPRRRSQTPGDGDALGKQGQLVTHSGIRASPPENERDEGTTVSDTKGRQHEAIAEAANMGSAGVTVVPDSQSLQTPSTPTQRAPHVPSSGMGVGEDGEPSLPPTPSQSGLEPPRERSTGLLLRSPSKRLRRKGRSTVKSSPLKPIIIPPEDTTQRQDSLAISLGPRQHIANTPKPPPSPEEARLLQMRSRLDDLEKELRDIEDRVLRQLLVFSWHQDRAKEGKDIAKRRKDVVQRSTKIMQLRDEVLEAQAMQSVDHRQAVLEAIDRKATSRKIPTLTQRLANFLPFAVKPRPSTPRPPSPEGKDVEQASDLDNLQTSAEPFKMTISDTLLLPSAVDGSLLQRQDLAMSTEHELLTCELQLTTKITSQQISHLEVQRLSAWAEPELGPWLRQPREETELAALGNAFGRYWEAAKLRGDCWIRCKQDFSDLVANAPASDNLLVHLGMQDLVFARSNVELKVHWAIALGDRGEAENQGSAYARFPPSWQQGGNGELARIGDAFSMLVEDRGIAEAIGVICKVVFPT